MICIDTGLPQQAREPDLSSLPVITVLTLWADEMPNVHVGAPAQETTAIGSWNQ